MNKITVPPKNRLALKISQMFGCKISTTTRKISIIHDYNQVVTSEGDSSTPLESISSLLEHDFVQLTVVLESQ